MSALELIRQQYRQMEWADAAVWQSVLASGRARGDTRIRELMHHIHLCQRAWLQIWRQEPIDATAGESLDLEALVDWGREYHADAKRYLARISDSELGIEARAPWSGEIRRPARVGETMLQIPSHTTYHRGQVNSRLREIGGRPASTDFVVWIWQGEPRAEWPSVRDGSESPGLARIEETP